MLVKTKDKHNIYSYTATGESVMECLIRLNLTEFIDYVVLSDLLPIFVNVNESGLELTVFVPTNAAFEAVRGELDDVDPDVLVRNHIVEGTIDESDLVFDQRFQTLQNTSLHSTTVVFADQSYLQYNQHYSSRNRGIRYIHVSSFS